MAKDKDGDPKKLMDEIWRLAEEMGLPINPIRQVDTYGEGTTVSFPDLDLGQLVFLATRIYGKAMQCGVPLEGFHLAVGLPLTEEHGWSPPAKTE